MKTRINFTTPWHMPQRKGSRVLCPDGKIRSLAYLAYTTDSYFTITAGVRAYGDYISGYVATLQASVDRFNRTELVRVFCPHDGQNMERWDNEDQIAMEENRPLDCPVNRVLLQACPELLALATDKIYSDDSH